MLTYVMTCTSCCASRWALPTAAVPTGGRDMAGARLPAACLHGVDMLLDCKQGKQANKQQWPYFQHPHVHGSGFCTRQTCTTCEFPLHLQTAKYERQQQGS